VSGAWIGMLNFELHTLCWKILARVLGVLGMPNIMKKISKNICRGYSKGISGKFTKVNPFTSSEPLTPSPHLKQ
jgi:hypothetical protein